MNFEEEDISIANCLPRKRRLDRTRANKATNHPTIIVRSVSRQKRNEIYANCFKTKDIEGFLVDGIEKLFIQEKLTRRGKRLFWNIKQKAKELGYQFFLIHNGQIHTRKDEESEKFYVKSEIDLEQL